MRSRSALDTQRGSVLKEKKANEMTQCVKVTATKLDGPDLRDTQVDKGNCLT